MQSGNAARYRSSRLISRVRTNSPRTRLLASNRVMPHKRHCATLFEPQGRKSLTELAKRLYVATAQEFGSYTSVAERSGARQGERSGKQLTKRREIDRLDHEGTGPMLRRPSHTVRIPVGRHHHRGQTWERVFHGRQKLQTVHVRHVEVGNHRLDVGPVRQDRKRVQPRTGEQELVLTGADLAPHTLAEHRLHVGLIIDDQYHTNLLIHNQVTNLQEMHLVGPETGPHTQ